MFDFLDGADSYDEKHEITGEDRVVFEALYEKYGYFGFSQAIHQITTAIMLKQQEEDRLRHKVAKETFLAENEEDALETLSNSGLLKTFSSEFKFAYKKSKVKLRCVEYNTPLYSPTITIQYFFGNWSLVKFENGNSGRVKHHESSDVEIYILPMNNGKKLLLTKQKKEYGIQDPVNKQDVTCDVYWNVAEDE